MESGGDTIVPGASHHSCVYSLFNGPLCKWGGREAEQCGGRRGGFKVLNNIRTQHPHIKGGGTCRRRVLKINAEDNHATQHKTMLEQGLRTG